MTKIQRVQIYTVAEFGLIRVFINELEDVRLTGRSLSTNLRSMLWEFVVLDME